MNNPTLVCQDKQRRHEVRKRPAEWNGIDYLEVDSLDQTTLRIYFLNNLGENRKRMSGKNVRITGGRRIRDIKVQEQVRFCPPEELRREDIDDCLVIKVDKAGDFSTYTLCLVEVDQEGHPIVERISHGRPVYRPLAGFDPRYACIDFTFKAGCPSDLDCKPQVICPPEERTEPEINYLAKDYASFRQLILDRLALIMPDWQERHVPDLGITLVELLAYVGDYLSYYQDALATEAYLDTARQRISVRRHARLVDYQMHEGCNARAWVCMKLEGAVKLPLDAKDTYFITRYDDAPVTGKPLTPDDLRNVAAGRYEVFEPLVPNGHESIELYEAHNKIYFYTWGDRECCLPRGTTRATLVDGTARRVTLGETKPDAAQTVVQQTSVPKPTADARETWTYERALHLQPGDFLVFEEITGPRTGNPADADPSHRHVVRLTQVSQAIDELYHQPVLEVKWAEEDALPFPLCISAIGPPPECDLLENISVARGNVILVDHGSRVDDEELGIVPARTTTVVCEGEGQPSDVETVPARFRPALQRAPLTFSQPLPAKSPASRLLVQDPRQAVPKVDLKSIPPVPGDDVPLFLPTDLKDPDSLARRLQAPIDVAASHLRQLLSKGTRQLLKQYTGIGPLPGQLSSALKDDLGKLLQQWKPQRDLLGSRQDDLHFVVEMDDAGRGHLRFGDGELGHLPEAGTAFLATYRVGNGPAGNVGAETISHIVFRRNPVSGVTLQPRNPLPASGGTAPEPLAEVKLFAPHAFRKVLERAITADDYAALVMRGFNKKAAEAVNLSQALVRDKVQWAAATLRWTGSWYEVLVAIDPYGQTDVDEDLLKEIEAYLYRYRRIGHDLVVAPAHYVPLDIQMTVCVLPDYLRGHVEAALLDLFSNRRLLDGRLGFFHPDNLTFGEGIFLSKLVALARSVPGVENVIVDKLQRYGELPNHEIENGILPLGPYEVARLDNDLSFPENGQLKLEMGGGR